MLSKTKQCSRVYLCVPGLHALRYYPTRLVGAKELIGWSRKRSKRWAAIVLPGLLLRALIPVGFMPMFGPDFGVQLTLCEGYAPVPSTAMDMSMDMPMDMPIGLPVPHHPGGESSPGGSGPDSHQDHSACPYGASPTFAALPALANVLLTVQPSQQSRQFAPQVAHYAIAPRAQSPRGPPLEV